MSDSKTMTLYQLVGLKGAVDKATKEFSLPNFSMTVDIKHVQNGRAQAHYERSVERDVEKIKGFFDISDALDWLHETVQALNAENEVSELVTDISSAGRRMAFLKDCKRQIAINYEQFHSMSILDDEEKLKVLEERGEKSISLNSGEGALEFIEETMKELQEELNKLYEERRRLFNSITTECPGDVFDVLDEFGFIRR